MFNAAPGRLEEIEDRLAALDRLKRKYGQTLKEVIAFGAEAARQLAEVENRDALLVELKAKEEQDAAAYRTVAAQLTASRVDAAKRLEKLAEAQINDLAMNTRFHVQVTAERSPASWTAHGWDQVECLIATNAGEPLKPLHEIASGGEMSRVMLALKVTVEEAASGGSGRKKKTVLPRTLVFDEIDIGIGGPGGRGGGPKAEDAVEGPASAVHYAPSADCSLRRPALPHREDREARAHPDRGSSHGGFRADAGDRPHAEWGEADRDQPEARGPSAGK